jgi:hypothetical protein
VFLNVAKEIEAPVAVLSSDKEESKQGIVASTTKW